jgi:AraC-like DNA-binding protein
LIDAMASTSTAASAETAPLQLLRHESELGSWEMVRRPPAPALAGLVDGTYCGWTETMSPGPIRRELPTTKVPLIFNFGAGYRIGAPGGAIEQGEVHASFAAGLYESFAETQATGPTRGLQVDLTPLGALRLLGLPLSDLAGRGVALADVLGAGGQSLIERLAEGDQGGGAWETRFRILDEVLLARLASAAEPSPPVAWALRRLETSGGRAPIAPLAAAVGWSQKHLIERFRRCFGATPKRLARIVRFSGFAERLGRASRVDWAGMALASGYYDQAHLIRDCRAFAGCTPRGLLARRLPGGGWLGGAEPAGPAAARG